MGKQIDIPMIKPQNEEIPNETPAPRSAQKEGKRK
jgi:hypothetical protein